MGKTGVEQNWVIKKTSKFWKWKIWSFYHIVIAQLGTNIE